MQLGRRIYIDTDVGWARCYCVNVLEGIKGLKAVIITSLTCQELHGEAVVCLRTQVWDGCLWLHASLGMCKGDIWFYMKKTDRTLYREEYYYQV